MQIEIYKGLKGAEKAEGIVAVIDVFRAFSMECWMYANGAEAVIPTGSVEDSFALRDQNPSWLIAGERNGIKVEGFDFGNSPSEIEHLDLHGKTIIHTTSAGVQGLMAVGKADEILPASLLNAKAVAEYILKKDPAKASIVAMGWNGIKETEEDTLCAEYIQSLLIGEPLKDIKEQALALKETEGKKFFDPKMNHIFPERDFWLCIEADRFDHVIRAVPHGAYFQTEWL